MLAIQDPGELRSRAAGLRYQDHGSEWGIRGLSRRLRRNLGLRTADREGTLPEPGVTEKTLTGSWARTGDMRRVDVEEYLDIVDYAKDVVIRGGENNYSSEVENVLYGHPAVTDAALIGLPTRRLARFSAI